MSGLEESVNFDLAPQTLASQEFEQLEQARQQAKEIGDFQALQAIAVAARSRDGWDDTDPAYYYLALRCDEDVKDVMTYYG